MWCSRVRFGLIRFVKARNITSNYQYNISTQPLKRRVRKGVLCFGVLMQGLVRQLPLKKRVWWGRERLGLSVWGYARCGTVLQCKA